MALLKNAQQRGGRNVVGIHGGALVLESTSVALLSIWLLVWYLPPSTTLPD